MLVQIAVSLRSAGLQLRYAHNKRGDLGLVVEDDANCLEVSLASIEFSSVYIGLDAIEVAFAHGSEVWPSLIAPLDAELFAPSRHQKSATDLVNALRAQSVRVLRCSTIALGARFHLAIADGRMPYSVVDKVVGGKERFEAHSDVVDYISRLTNA